jgi:hypothetical protein
MGNRSIARPLAAFAVFAALAAPLPSRAAITVEPPTGNADPALLADLHTWMRLIAEEQGGDAGIDAVLRIDAVASGEDVTLTLELAPGDGSAPIRDSRTASRVSAAAQGRAMARAAIRTVAGSRAATAAPAVGNEELPAPPAGPYDEKKLVTASLLVTVSGALAGAGLTIGAYFSLEGMLGLGITGGVVGGLSLALGPAIGHLWVRNNVQGALGLVGRLALAGSSTALLMASTMVGFFGTWGSGCEESGDCDQEVAEDDRTKRIYIGVGVGLEVAAVAWAIIDLAALPRAVRRANAAAGPDSGKEKISGVSFAPLIAPGPNGTAVTGLVFSMRY